MRAVIIDDHAGVAAIMSRALGQSLHCTMLPPIGSCAEASTRLPKEKPDLVILDNQLEDGRGVDLLKGQKSRLPQTRWLLYSAYMSPPRLHEAIALGIDGTVSKRAPAEVLMRAAKALLAGQRFHCAITSQTLRDTQPSVALTKSEQEILRLVAAGYEAKEIAADLGLAHKTVLNELVAIRHKTGAQTHVQLAEYAKNFGFASAW